MSPHKKNPHEAEDRARLIIALAISLIILLGFNFVVKPKLHTEPQVEAKTAAQRAEIAKEEAVKELTREEAILSSGKRIGISGDKVSGSIALKGNRFDDLLLNDQYTTVENTQNVALLTPRSVKHAYYIETGWLSDDKDVVLPGNDSVWSVKPGSPKEISSDGKPVVLEWNNGHGVTFEREIALDRNYLFTVTQRVTNHSGRNVKLNAYHAAARQGLPENFSGLFVLHEGPIGFFNGEEEAPQYKDLFKGKTVEKEDVRGWIGITDKYWMVTLLPNPDSTFNARMVAQPNGPGPNTIYQADAVSGTIEVADGGNAEETTHIYAGVKNLDLIHAYEQQYKFDRLELTMDFGMWYFITKPFYYLLHLLMNETGNIAAAILLMTVIVRACVFPLASKSFRSMAKMRLVQPQMKEIQEKYKADRPRMQAELFELYKKEGVNPFSGCWPVMIQIPIFFALYKVILISIELRHAPFWGWVQDLSAPDPTTLFNLFGLIPWTPPQALMIGGWPILFCLSMIIQQRISPPPADPTQETVQKYFPIFITFMMAHFAVGLVIYWTWSNIIGTLQQFYILKKVGGEETSLIRGHSARRKPKKKKTEGHAAKH